LRFPGLFRGWDFPQSAAISDEKKQQRKDRQREKEGDSGQGTARRRFSLIPDPYFSFPNPYLSRKGGQKMENQVMETLSTLLKEFQKYGATESVIGKELHIGEITIVPITKISLGVGAGGGENDKKGEGKGSGGGGGLKVEPVAFLIIQKDRVSLLCMGKKGPLDTISEQIPALLNKWIEKQTTPAKENSHRAGSEDRDG
jgi:uncharacterized spore protein YtfJ